MTGEEYMNDYICDACGSSDVEVSNEREHFEYGVGSDRCMLAAVVLVKTCGECGMQTVAEGAEEARAEAVASHLGVISPCRLRAFRGASGCSRAELSKVTGIGEASIYRWEKGDSIPSIALGRYLLLVKYIGSLEKIEQIVKDEARVCDQAATEENFPHLKNLDRTKQQAEKFSLH